MAVTVDWGTKVITVPQADLTLISGTLYELDTNSLRLELKGLEDDPDGMAFERITKHNTEVTVAGVTYARTIEIINGYSLEFEDAQYSVRLVGSNNNFFDIESSILIQNQVQVIPTNSAGLISVGANENQSILEYLSYHGGVTVDILAPTSGTTYPAGTEKYPVNNIPDGVVIAENKGLDTLYIRGNLTLGTGDDVAGFKLIGQNNVRTLLQINSDAYIAQSEIVDCRITGTLDGGAVVRNCDIFDLNYVNGYIYNSMITGTITLGGNAIAYIFDCKSGVPGASTPTIDMGGSGQSMALRGYDGGVRLTNKTGPDAISIDLASGQVKIDDTCVNGQLVVRGDGKVMDFETSAHMGSGMYNGNLELLNEANSGYQMHDIWELFGLNPNNPMTISPTQHSSNSLNVTITDNGNGSVTLIRQ